MAFLHARFLILNFPRHSCIPFFMTARKTIKVTAWPDPLVQERLEDMGFFFDNDFRTWIRFCGEQEVQTTNKWLKRHPLPHKTPPAKGRGETRKHPKLSDQLKLKNGGSHNTCGLCGKTNTPCR